MMELHVALSQVEHAYLRARLKHKPMQSPHEGYAILLEEVDELWQEIKKWQPAPGAGVPFLELSTEDKKLALDRADNLANMKKEALHVAAMAVAFMIEAIK